MIYSMHNYYISGEWNLICDVCGKKVKAGKAKQRWDGGHSGAAVRRRFYQLYGAKQR